MGRVGCLVCRRCGPGTGGCLGLVVFVRLLVDEAVQFRHSRKVERNKTGKKEGLRHYMSMREFGECASF